MEGARQIRTGGCRGRGNLGCRHAEGERPNGSDLIAGRTTHRTAALQARLATNTKVALVAIVHRLAIDSILDGDGESIIQISPTDEIIYADDSPDMKGSAALAEMQEEAKDAEKGLPKDGDKLWDWLLKQDQKRLLEILAVCVASTVDAVNSANRSTGYHADEEAVSQLATASSST